MKELRVRNHFVPRFYLKAWQNESSKVCVYKTLVSHPNAPLWREYSTSAIAYHNHLYTKVVSGSESDELELFLEKEYETPAAPVLEKVLLERKLTPDDWDVLIRFLASQDVRTPARLFEHLKEGGKYISDVLEELTRDLEQDLETGRTSLVRENAGLVVSTEDFPLMVTAEIEKNDEFGKFKIESYIGRNTWLHTIKHVLSNTAKVLHTHKWSIVKPAKGYSWFASDNPVIKLNYTDSKNYDFRGGWGREKGNIIFPIGPEHAMFVQIGEKPLWRGRLTVPQTLLFRKLIAENSHRMIISAIKDSEVPTLKPRIVDGDQLKNEREWMEKWHVENSELEKKFIRSNRAN